MSGIAKGESHSNRRLAGKAAVLTAALVLGGCEMMPGQSKEAPKGFAAEAIGPIETEEQLRAHVVDRNLYYGEDTVIITSAGRLGGTVSGEPLTGTWHWDDRYWCRTVTSEQDLSLTDCQVFEATSEGLQATSKRGEGVTFLYTLELFVPDATTEPAATDATSTDASDTASEAIATEEIEATPLEPVEEAEAPAQ